MSDVQIAVIDQQDTQIVLAVPGVQGATGSSIPAGGTIDQVLRKNSSTDYDAGWTQVTSAMIANGTIVNEDVNNSAAIAGTKISPDFGGQAVTTTGQVNAARVNVTGNTAPSNGIYLPSSNNVAISTNGEGRLFVNSDGKIGVGASSATHNLTVTTSGTDAVKINTADYGYLDLSNGTSTVRLQNVANVPRIGTATNHPLVFATNEVERMRLDTSGALNFVGAGTAGSTQAVSFNGSAPVNSLVIDSSGRVGLGTSSPNYQLHVTTDFAVGASGFNQQLTFSNDTIQSLLLGTGYTSLKLNPLGGNVGVGTSSPSTALDVSGQITTRGSIGAVVFEPRDASGSVFSFYNPTGDDLRLFANSNDRVTITSGGLVGVGTTSPGAALDVNGGVWARSPFISWNGTTRGGDIETTTAGRLNIRSYNATGADGGEIIFLRNNSGGDSESARIDSSGRLLVGTSSTPVDGRLVVAGNSVFATGANSFGQLKIRSNTSTPGNGETLGVLEFSDPGSGNAATIIAARDGGTWTTNTSNPGRLVFSTNAGAPDTSPTERVRITSSGYLKASNSGSYYAVSNPYHEFLGAGSDDLIAHFENTTATNPYGIRIRFSGASPNDATRYFLSCIDSSATVRTEIRSNGGLANYQANNVNLSDRYAKKDISPAAGTWDCIKHWEIVNYRYKDQPDDADLNLGVIAQQVAESCPEVITIFEEAKDDQPEKLGIKEQQMYWMAIKALQEAQVRIEALEAEVAALKAQ